MNQKPKSCKKNLTLRPLTPTPKCVCACTFNIRDRTFHM